MAVCQFEGNGDMYGLGIRLGYYLQWFGAVFAAWLAPSEVNPLRFTLNLFVAATFLALIILTAQDVNSLEPVETYIVLLLMFGVYIALIPIYIWRLFTRCDPFWDPSRWPLVRSSAMFANLSLILLVGVLVYQYWFWFARVPGLDKRGCQQYGFLFGQVRLDSKVSVTVNALLYVILGVICLYILALKVRYMAGLPDPYADRPKRKISRRHLRAHVDLLRNIDNWIKLIVAIAVTVAVEVTISWNNIDNVNSLSGAGQTIPFIIGLGAVIRILYVYAFRQDDDYGDSDSDSYYSHRTPRPLPDRDLPNTRYNERLQHRHDRPLPTHNIPPVYRQVRRE